MDEKTKQRIEEIQKRLKEYHKPPDGPSSPYYYSICYRSEIIKDVEFLLNVIDNKVQTKEKMHKFRGKSARAFIQSKMKK